VGSLFAITAIAPGSLEVRSSAIQRAAGVVEFLAQSVIAEIHYTVACPERSRRNNNGNTVPSGGVAKSAKHVVATSIVNRRRAESHAKYLLNMSVKAQYPRR
jgi:hypothetical protein